MLKANYTDKQIVLDILCKSFDSNQSVNYVVKQDKHRKRRVRTLMDYSFELCMEFGQIYLSDKKEGCALIFFPDQKRNSLKTILLDVKLIRSTIGLNKIEKVLQRNALIKNSYPTNKISYLWFIGVDPSSQQKGIGSDLLKGIINESDRLKRPIYLETSMPENLSFYKKMGFSIYKELNFGHHLYLLRHEFN